jgi:hypothetical protein
LLGISQFLTAESGGVPDCSLTPAQGAASEKAFDELAHHYQHPVCLECHGGKEGASPTKDPDLQERQSFPGRSAAHLCLITKSDFGSMASERVEDPADKFLTHIQHYLQLSGQTADLHMILGKARAWIQAMGGTFPPPAQCGCKIAVNVPPVRGTPGQPGSPPGPGSAGTRTPSTTPNFKLSIHHKWEVNGPGGHLLSEATFPIDLMPNQRGDLFGQSSVARTYQTVGSLPIPCIDKGQWAERWQAYGIFDEKGENLTITKPHTIPGFSSDSVRTPLDQFKLPVQDGAKQQFVFDFGGFAKNVVDVKLEEVGSEKK